jgi:site-specific DNA-methyltransferase (adenine-specific)
MDSCSVDAIITDIPYGIGFDDWDVLHHNTNSAYGTASKAQLDKGSLYKRRGKPLNGWSEADKQIAKEYQDWCSTWGTLALDTLKPGGSCFIFAGRRYAHRCICSLEDCGFTFKDMLAWEKPRAAHRAQHLSAIYDRRGDQDSSERWSGWKVANLRPLFEPILWFQKPYKTGGTIATNVLEYGVGAWNEKALDKYCTPTTRERAHSNIICTAVTKNDRGLHPAQKPLSLMQLLVELVTIEGQTVLDPFCGSGTTCLAAKGLGRKYIGFERDAEMASIAAERLADAETNTLF